MESLKKVWGVKVLDELNEEELKRYEWIKSERNITRKEYQKHFDFMKKKAQRHLTKMVKLGIIDRKGAGPSIYYVYYPFFTAIETLIGSLCPDRIGN